MSSALDKSLDDLIKSNKSSGPGNTREGRGSRGSGPGPARRLPNRSGNRAAPYPVEKPIPAPDSTWQHDMYSDQMTANPGPAPGPGPGRAAAIETGTKLYISNLDYGVSNDDIKELFSEVGDLKRSSVHYDRSGRSKGTAEVVFSRRADAVAAVKRYNNVQLDGKPMKIEIIGTNIMTPAAPVPQSANGVSGKSNGLPKSAPGTSSSTGGSRGGGRRRPRGRRLGKGRKEPLSARKEPLSAEGLDADLEKYHSEAMQIN